MAEVTTLARPYAEALFDLAKSSGSLPGWSDLLREVGALAAHPDVRDCIFLSLIKSPIYGQAQNALRLLIDNDRLVLLPQIQAQFETLRGEHEGVADADVASAFPLSDAELAQLTAALEKTFKRKIRPAVRIESDLIGGVRVTVGDEVLDASVRGRLTTMAAALQS